MQKEGRRRRRREQEEQGDRSRVPVMAAISSTVFAPEGRGKRPAT